MIQFEDDQFLEYKIIFSLLAQRPIIVKGSLTDFHHRFLELIKLLCHGTSFFEELIENQKILKFNPGSIISGKHTFSCGKHAISMFLEPLLVLLPFSKKISDLTFVGITNQQNSLSIDAIKLVHLKIVEQFKIPQVVLTIKKRGFAPLGQGEVHLLMSNVQNLVSISFYQQKLFKIRGIAISGHLNSTIAHSMINKTKQLLGSDYQSDFENDSDDDGDEDVMTKNVKIFCDIANKHDCGPSPGYQLVLFAEGKNLFFGEQCKTSEITDSGCQKDLIVDDVVESAVFELLESIDSGGAFDRKCFKLLFSCLCLNVPEMSEVEIFGLSENDRVFLGILERFFKFQYEVVDQDNCLVFRSFGTNYSNLFKVPQ